MHIDLRVIIKEAPRKSRYVPPCITVFTDEEGDRRDIWTEKYDR